MAVEPSTSRPPVISCALAMASETTLDARLAAVARHAAQVTSGSAAVLLLDDAMALRPAAVHGPHLDALAAIDASPGGGTPDPAVQAVLDRREVVVAHGHPSALLAAAPAAGCAVHVPMALEQADEGATVEGVLAVTCPSDPPNAESLDALRALAALGALATAHARLEIALAERSDWLDRLAHTDSLTGLANRRTLDRVLELELARAARQATTLCVAIFGVDGLEALTERDGAHAADDMLRRVAASLADTVRLVDTVARYGRSEFVVAAPGSTGLAMARRAAAAIGQLEGDGPARPRVSVGVATYPPDGSTADEVLAAAERALAEARERGGAIVSAS